MEEVKAQGLAMHAMLTGPEAHRVERAVKVEHERSMKAAGSVLGRVSHQQMQLTAQLMAIDEVLATTQVATGTGVQNSAVPHEHSKVARNAEPIEQLETELTQALDAQRKAERKAQAAAEDMRYAKEKAAVLQKKQREEDVQKNKQEGTMQRRQRSGSERRPRAASVGRRQVGLCSMRQIPVECLSAALVVGSERKNNHTSKDEDSEDPHPEPQD